jgi:hypothetical protein
MIKTKKNRNTIFVILLLIILVAPTSIIVKQKLIRDTIRESMFEKHQTCNLPCWNEITPGFTAGKEVINILEETAYIKKGSMQQAGSDNNGGCIWNWTVSGKRQLPKIGWENGIVNEITLGLPFNLSVDEVLDEFGNPEAVSIWRGGIPEHWYWIIDMLYPQAGIQVKAYTKDFSSIIESSSEVGVVILFSPTTIENRINKIYPDPNVRSTIRLYSTWKGYGDLEILYKSNNE